MVDLGMGRVTYSFLMILECSYSLLGRDLLTKIKVQIHFSSDGAKLLYHNGAPVKILVTSTLTEEYRLHQKPVAPDPSMQDWLQKFPLPWAERGGMGMASHWPPAYVKIKSRADPVKVHQYLMPLKARRGITPHIR